jgi:hypothetical protein
VSDTPPILPAEYLTDHDRQPDGQGPRRSSNTVPLAAEFVIDRLRVRDSVRVRLHTFDTGRAWAALWSRPINDPACPVTTTCIVTDPTDPLTRESVDLIGELLWPDISD